MYKNNIFFLWKGKRSHKNIISKYYKSCAWRYWIFLHNGALAPYTLTVCYSPTCCGLLISGRLYTIVWQFCAPARIKRLVIWRLFFLFNRKSLNIYANGAYIDPPKNQIWFEKYYERPASILKLFRMINSKSFSSRHMAFKNSSAGQTPVRNHQRGLFLILDNIISSFLREAFKNVLAEFVR